MFRLILGSPHKETRWWRACSWSITRLHPVGWIWKWHTYRFPIQEKIRHMRYESWHPNNGEFQRRWKIISSYLKTKPKKMIKYTRRDKTNIVRIKTGSNYIFLLSRTEFMGMETTICGTCALLFLWKAIHLPPYMHKYLCKIYVLRTK